MHRIPFPEGTIRAGYLLFDPWLMRDKEFLAQLSKQVCEPNFMEPDNALLPALLDVSELAGDQQDRLTALLRESLESDIAQSVCALIDCDAGMPVLMRHLNRYLIGPNADGELSMFTQPDGF